MKNEKHSRILGLFAVVVIVILLTVVACSSSNGTLPSTPETANSPPPASQSTPAPTDAWFTLLQSTPYPYTTPLPPPTRTTLDGTYTKVEPQKAEHVRCRRCPDYAPEGGIWKLRLDKGIFKIFHEDTGWRGLASFTVSEDQMVLFNDPVCTDIVGVYTWKSEGGALTLKVIEDECAIRLRAMNLTSLPWLSCQPPSGEAAVTDHWPKPLGCQ